jgi:hypothetical protein
MTTITATISQSTADGHQLTGGGVDVTATGIYIHDSRHHGAFVFTIPDIASGDTINSATFRAYVLNTTYDDLDHSIYAEDTDNADWISTTDYDISGRTPTTASKTFTASSIGSGSYDFTGLADVIQEVIDRPGWSAGNRLCLVVYKVSSSGLLRLEAYDHADDHPAQLIIDYTAGSPAAAARGKLSRVRVGTKIGGILT